MKTIVWILSLALLWAVTGILVGLGIASISGQGNWILPCGLLNIVIGMTLLQITTRNEAARKLFYEGKKEDDYISLGIVALWSIPIALAFLGIVWWIMGRIFPP